MERRTEFKKYFNERSCGPIGVGRKGEKKVRESFQVLLLGNCMNSDSIQQGRHPGEEASLEVRDGGLTTFSL